MHVESIEIYSDMSNMPVMRHPGRRFPGVLIQGDKLYALFHLAQSIREQLGRETPGFEEAEDLREQLAGCLEHYKEVLAAHGIALPF
jgi:hypothetical protein